MNVDDLDKEQPLKDLIQYLFQKFGKDKFEIKDHWDSDETAIGFIDVTGQYLVYISTLALQNSGYYVALENPSLNEELPYEPAGYFNNLSLDEVEVLFKKHLRLG